MLIKKDPAIAVINDENVCQTRDIMDFWRPNYSDFPYVDGHFSTKQYLDCLTTTFEEYKKQLFYDIYFVDIDKLDDNIENFFKEISKLRNREIVKILKNDFEIVIVYLNTGKIWEAFLKKDDKIYLNTELDVSIDVTDIVEKYYKKS